MVTATDVMAAPQPQPGPTPSVPADAVMSAPNDPGFKAWVQKYGQHWDPADSKGWSGGYNLYQAYKLGLTPDSAGHLPDIAKGQVLKSDDDPNAITAGIDNRTGYQVAPPTYTGPMTASIIKNASKYFYAGTAFRVGGPGAWDDIPAGQKAPALRPPKGYTLKATLEPK